MALAVTIAPVVLLACGAEGQSSEDEEVVRQIEGIAGLAVGAYASSGPGALFDYLSEDAAGGCSPAALREVLESEPQPRGFREVRDIRLSGDQATATVVFATNVGEREAVWTFVRNETSWRIDDLPGLEGCRQ